MRLTLPLIFCVLPALVCAGETPIPSAPKSWVTDAAGYMSPAAVQKLEKRLESYENDGGKQVVVYIGKTTGGVPIEDWSARAFKAWKVGRKGKDNGAALFIMSDDRRMRIEAGYGAEGTLTDALSSRIINEVIEPKLLANDRDGGVASGVEAIINVLEGRSYATVPPVTADPTDADPSRVTARKPLTTWQMIFYGIIGLVLLIMLVTHPSFTLYLLINILTSGRGGGGFSSGGGGGGGGGFVGGGGRSGGGGASGSW